MKKNYYDNPAEEENLSYEEETYQNLSDLPIYDEEDDYSYADEDHSDSDDIPEKSAGKGSRKHSKSAARIFLEEQFVAAYQEYMHPTQKWSAYRIDCQLDDLYALLYQLNRGWAYRKAKAYKLAGFPDAEGDDALSIGCTPVYDMLKADRAAGNYSDHPIGHYLKIAQNKAIDNYFRKNFGRLPPKKKPSEEDAEQDPTQTEEPKRRRKIPLTVSIDEPWANSDGTYQGDRLSEASVDPFANIQRPRWERDSKAARLSTIYLRELMDYPSEPQKPLALMYGNILFQLAKDYGGDDELSMMAKKSPKVSSPDWAHLRMGNARLVQLGIYSERIVQKCYGKSLSWGSDFQHHMQERNDDGSGRKWADIVYTKSYTKKNTSEWIESISKSTMIKCARILKDDPDLAEYAMETFSTKNKFRKALEKTEKEACR